MGEFLAIDGWEEFQSLRGKGLWIKDATDQQDKPKLGGLSFCEIGVLQQLRRLRGRTGKNIKYDITYIAGAIHAKVTDRAHLHHAIGTLISRGVLIVTDQAHSSFNEGEKEIEKENKKEKKPSAKAAPRGPGNNSKMAKATGETRHTRVKQILEGWYRDWTGSECPWDGGEAKQLDSLLKATPRWVDTQFIACLDHMARSDCIPKGDRPREWLGKLPKFLHGPLDRFWKPMQISEQQRLTEVWKDVPRDPENPNGLTPEALEYARKIHEKERMMAKGAGA